MEGEESGSLGSLRELNRGRVVTALREMGVASRGRHRTPHRSLPLDRGRRSWATSSTTDSSSPRGRLAGRPGDGRRPAAHPDHASPPPPGAAVGIDFGKRHPRGRRGRPLAHDPGRDLERDGRGLPAARGLDAGRGPGAQAAAPVAHAAGASARRRDGPAGPDPHRTGTIGSSAILPAWIGIRGADEMHARLSLPVRVENDANLGALAELTWGAGRGCQHLAYLKVSNGIGAGMIVEGRLFPRRGRDRRRGGHTILDETGDILPVRQPRLLGDLRGRSGHR